MIGYVCLGTNDLPRACAFFDALLSELGASRAMQSPRYVFWATGPSSPMLAAVTPYDGQAASVSNGGMTAIAVQDPATVDRLHAKALALGARDEGAPGPRGGGFYAGYFRDLDGNKLNVFCIVRS